MCQIGQTNSLPSGTGRYISRAASDLTSANKPNYGFFLPPTFDRVYLGDLEISAFDITIPGSPLAADKTYSKSKADL
jgi:hypothetical protein